MKTSDTITKIMPALLKAQRGMGGAVKGANNPYFKSKYADLSAVLEASKDLLNDNGIIILQPHTTSHNGTFVETLLVHESGEWVSSETKVVYGKENDPQAQGSAITYARRYGLQSLLSMPAVDDDAEGSMSRAKPAYSAPKSAPKLVESPTVANNASVAGPATPDNSIKATEALPAGAVQAAPKRSSFKNAQAVAAPAAAAKPTNVEGWG